jgi:hypothetical protein
VILGDLVNDLFEFLFLVRHAQSVNDFCERGSVFLGDLVTDLFEYWFLVRHAQSVNDFCERGSVFLGDLVNDLFEYLFLVRHAQSVNDFCERGSVFLGDLVNDLFYYLFLVRLALVNSSREATKCSLCARGLEAQSLAWLLRWVWEQALTCLRTTSRQRDWREIQP